MCVDQQQVACCAPLHPAEDVLTGGWAALSHQEVTAAGEQGLCLLSSQPGTEGSQRGTDIMGGGGVAYWVVGYRDGGSTTCHGTSPPSEANAGAIGTAGHRSQIPHSLMAQQRKTILLWSLVSISCTKFSWCKGWLFFKKTFFFFDHAQNPFKANQQAD